MDAGETAPDDKALALVPAHALADEFVDDIAEGAELTVGDQVALLTALRRVQAAELDPVRCRRAGVEALGADVGWLALADVGGDGFAVVQSAGADEITALAPSVAPGRRRGGGVARAAPEGRAARADHHAAHRGGARRAAVRRAPKATRASPAAAARCSARSPPRAR